METNGRGPYRPRERGKVLLDLLKGMGPDTEFHDFRDRAQEININVGAHSVFGYLYRKAFGFGKMEYNNQLADPAPAAETTVGTSDESARSGTNPPEIDELLTVSEFCGRHGGLDRVTGLINILKILKHGRPKQETTDDQSGRDRSDGGEHGGALHTRDADQSA